MKMSRTGFIYLAELKNHILCRSCGQDTQQTFYKIGFTTIDPRTRKAVLETHCPFDVSKVKVVVWDKGLETFLHQNFSHCCTRSDGDKEWFVLSPEEVEMAEFIMDDPPNHQVHSVKKYRKRQSGGLDIDFSDL